MKSKNFIIPAIILSLALIFSITVLILMKNFSEESNEILAKSYDAAVIGDFEQSREYSEDFIKKLKTAEPMLTFVVRHAEIDSIKWASKRMKEYAYEQTVNDFLAENSALKDMIKHLFENERLVFQNVL